ncbi:MAG: F0F1 ATP synthase subunit delta [Puniceicoccales bacterium]|jgi:F0F1-type ATP synthase delta subunit|nr:F0F1 ATP synthase subunit delta [Puniceicoccales bacterium]
MRTKNGASAFAKKLLHISCDGKGLLCEDRILAIIKALPREHDTLVILKKYLIFVERKLHKQTMLISSPTGLSADTVENLREHFERALGQKFAPQTVIDGSLIAGIRIRAGDHIFEKSILGVLETLGTRA